MAKTKTGGFVPNRRFYRLVFEGELDGLIVLCRSASVAIYQDIAALADVEWHNPPTVDERALMDRLYEGFASVLASWNLEETTDPDDEDARTVPVPATAAGLRSQDVDLVHTLVTEWLDAVSSTLRGATATAEATGDVDRHLTPGELERTLAELSS